MIHRIISKFPTVFIKRCLLTQAYSCKSLWNERLNGIECRLSTNDLAIQLQSSLRTNTPISALDFDILMNKANEMDLRSISFILKIITDFRRTQEAIKVFESSSHAILRNLIDVDESYLAFDLIRNREKSGIFLDEVTVNYLIDKFIIESKWENAFFTAAEWILQENIEESPLGISMCLISCLHFYEKSLWQIKPSVVDVSKLPVEYKFIKYLKPNFFDDHFDLCNDKFRRRLLGKCLYLLANHLELIDKDNHHVDEVKYYKAHVGMLGLAFHEKLNDLILYMENWLNRNETVKLNKTLISTVNDLINTSERKSDNTENFHPTETDEAVLEALSKFQDIVNKFHSKQCIEDDDLLKNLMGFLTSKIERLCEFETPLVIKKYQKFMEYRVSIFNQTKLKLKNEQILERSKEKLLQLTEQEEMIKYFEKLPEILYKSWLAKRTTEEKRFSIKKSNEENLENLKKKAKPQFIVQHVQ